MAKPKPKPKQGQQQMSYRNDYNTYNATSVARQYHDYPQNQSVTQRKKKVSKKRKLKTVMVRSAEAKNLSFSIYFMLVIGFLSLLAVVVAGANVTLQRNKNTQLANQLREIEAQNSRLQNQILQARNSDEIEYIARNRLGMSEPLPHQTITTYLIPAVEVVSVFTAPVDQQLTRAEHFQYFFGSVRAFFMSENEVEPN